MVLWQRRPTPMKLAHLPPEVLADLRQGDRWRPDIDPGVDSKHEFWMDWGHFSLLTTIHRAPNREPTCSPLLGVTCCCPCRARIIHKSGSCTSCLALTA